MSFLTSPLKIAHMLSALANQHVNSSKNAPTFKFQAFLHPALLRLCAPLEDRDLP